MLKAEREKLILELLQRNGTLTVSILCEQLGVSEMTIRRDLANLAQQGLLRRVHGGAVNDLGRSYEPPFPLRSTQSIPAKQAIAQKAVDLILDGDSIALDVGSTTLEMARALQGKTNLTILTASLPIANEIAACFSLDSAVRLILSGGIVRPSELSMTGHIAENTYREFHVDKAFIGIAGISLEEGLTEYNLEDGLVKRSLMRNAREKIVVADGSKFGHVSFATVARVSDIDMIITDSSASPEIVGGLRRSGIEVIIADES